MDAKAIRKELIRERPHSRPTLKEITVIKEAFLSRDWEKAHQTKLYQKDGATYCHLLEVLSHNHKQ